MKIILVARAKIVRQALRSLLEKSQIHEVVGEAENGHEALVLAHRLEPEAVVVDLPRAEGLDMIRQIVTQINKPRVISLFDRGDAGFVHRVLAAGAAGVVPKQEGFENLRRVLHLVPLVTSGPITTTSHAAQEASCEHPRIQRSRPHSTLSHREQQVLCLLAEGWVAKQIAADLGLSIKTVETHRLHISSKLGIKSISALTKYALREGLISLHEENSDQEIKGR